MGRRVSDQTKFDCLYVLFIILSVRKLGFEQAQTLTQGVTVTLDLLERQLREAQEAHDHNQADRIQKKINKINQDIGRAKQKYEQSGRLSNINQRNRDLNLQMDNAAAKRKKENEMKSSGTEKEADPFARRETRPKILWITGNKKKKEEEKENQGGVFSLCHSRSCAAFYISFIIRYRSVEGSNGWPGRRR